MVIKMSNMRQLCPDILGPYLGDYYLKLSASEISKKVKIERRTEYPLGLTAISKESFIHSNLKFWVLAISNFNINFSISSNSLFFLNEMASLEKVNIKGGKIII